MKKAILIRVVTRKYKPNGIEEINIEPRIYETVSKAQEAMKTQYKNNKKGSSNLSDRISYLAETNAVLDNASENKSFLWQVLDMDFIVRSHLGTKAILLFSNGGKIEYSMHTDYKQAQEVMKQQYADKVPEDLSKMRSEKKELMEPIGSCACLYTDEAAYSWKIVDLSDCLPEEA